MELHPAVQDHVGFVDMLLNDLRDHFNVHS